MMVDKEKPKGENFDYQAKMFSESSINDTPPDSEKKEENTDTKEQVILASIITTNKE